MAQENMLRPVNLNCDNSHGSRGFWAPFPRCRKKARRLGRDYRVQSAEPWSLLWGIPLSVWAATTAGNCWEPIRRCATHASVQKPCCGHSYSIRDDAQLRRCCQCRRQLLL